MKWTTLDKVLKSQKIIKLEELSNKKEKRSKLLIIEELRRKSRLKDSLSMERLWWFRGKTTGICSQWLLKRTLTILMRKSTKWRQTTVFLTHQSLWIHPSRKPSPNTQLQEVQWRKTHTSNKQMDGGINRWKEWDNQFQICRIVTVREISSRWWRERVANWVIKQTRQNWW